MEPVPCGLTKKKSRAGSRFTHQVVDVLWQVGGKTLALEDPQDLVAGHMADLSDSMGIPENDTNLGRGQTFLGELENLLSNFVIGQLEPVRNGAAIGQSRLGNTLSGSVHTTHTEN